MMKFTLSHNLGDVLNGLSVDVTKAATDTADEITAGLKQDLRNQILNAGLGARLANTWRGQRYPGHPSLNAAAFVWSRAPDIIDAFDRGATIVPVKGSRYLAIPTDNCPPRRRGSGGKGSRMSPAQVEKAYNQPLHFFKGPNRRLFAYVNVVGAANKRGFRAGSAKRIASGKQVAAVVMFIFVPSVRMPKKFDIDLVAKRWADRVEGILAGHLA